MSRDAVNPSTDPSPDSVEAHGGTRVAYEAPAVRRLQAVDVGLIGGSVSDPAPAPLWFTTPKP